MSRFTSPVAVDSMTKTDDKIRHDHGGAANRSGRRLVQDHRGESGCDGNVIPEYGAVKRPVTGATNGEPD